MRMSNYDCQSFSSSSGGIRDQTLDEIESVNPSTSSFFYHDDRSITETCDAYSLDPGNILEDSTKEESWEEEWQLDDINLNSLESINVPWYHPDKQQDDPRLLEQTPHSGNNVDEHAMHQNNPTSTDAPDACRLEAGNMRSHNLQSQRKGLRTGHEESHEPCLLRPTHHRNAMVEEPRCSHWISTSEVAPTLSRMPQNREACTPNIHSDTMEIPPSRSNSGGDAQLPTSTYMNSAGDSTLSSLWIIGDDVNDWRLQPLHALDASISPHDSLRVHQLSDQNSSISGLSMSNHEETFTNGELSQLPESFPVEVVKTEPAVEPKPRRVRALLAILVLLSIVTTTVVVVYVTSLREDSASVAPPEIPSTAPSQYPSYPPTMTPSHVPSSAPSIAPSSNPSTAPSISPSSVPTFSPTLFPTDSPTSSPTSSPTPVPTPSPTLFPTPLTKPPSDPPQPSASPTLSSTLPPIPVETPPPKPPKTLPPNL